MNLPSLAPAPGGAALQRARGTLLAEFGLREPGAPTRIRRLHQAGALKLRIPRIPGRAAEAVIVNTAGGLAGGDRMDAELTALEGAELTLTTQAAERIYGALGGSAAEVSVRLRAQPGATLRFLPQETILFDGARLRRRLEVDCAPGARLLLAESVVLGREAMGESVREGLLRDRWRIRLAGRLAFAEELHLAGEGGGLGLGRAALNGARAFSTVLWVGEPGIALGEVRSLVGDQGGAGEVGRVGVARLVAPGGYELRRRLVPLLARLAGAPLPRVWML